jgi:hypothetical protein
MEPSMRDLISLYESAMSKDQQEKSLMSGTQKANDGFDNLSVDYLDKDRYTQDEKVKRLSFKPGGDADNPVDTYSLGHDGANKATQNFSSGEKLDILHNLKVSVEVLERLHHMSEYGIFSMNSNLPKEKLDEIKKMLTGMRAQIDELSDSLVDDGR